MSNKSSLEEKAHAHLREAHLWRSRSEAADALQRARAAFTEAGMRDAAAWCEAIRLQVVAGGIDEIMPLPATTLKPSPALRAASPKGRGELPPDPDHIPG